MERFFDLLFELSNEDRYKILLLIEEAPFNVTNLSKKAILSLPETSRHLSRLINVGLISKDVEGLHHLSSFGRLVLNQSREIEFSSVHMEYFSNHKSTHLPGELWKRLGDLKGSRYIDNTMEFLQSIENIVRESMDFVYLQVNEPPLLLLNSIIEAYKRGIKIKILQGGLQHGPLIDMNSLSGAIPGAPEIEEKNILFSSAFLFASETKAAVAFPNQKDDFDYRGFEASDKISLKWCLDLFDEYWVKGQERKDEKTASLDTLTFPDEKIKDNARIVVEGQNNPEVDAAAIQYAVDNFKEVILRGVFSLGKSQHVLWTSEVNERARSFATVLIRKSVIIRGEDRVDDVPSTKLFKSGWTFPTSEWDYLFRIKGEDIEVEVENLHFTDFNIVCIGGDQAHKITIRKNRITLSTGIGRGFDYGKLGYHVLGINVAGDNEDDAFNGGVIIEDNYIDLAKSYIRGGFLSLRDREKDPSFRPTPTDFDKYLGFGINVNRVAGQVVIRNNTILNVNSRSIAIHDNFKTSEFIIQGNFIKSSVYGSYSFGSQNASEGITVQNAWSRPLPGHYVEIIDNKIEFEKLNHAGICIFGPIISGENVKKLTGGLIKDNEIDLKGGSVGIHIRKCDDFEVSGNKVTGEAYYGIRVSGRRITEGLDLRSIGNHFEDNDLAGLKIKEQDEYSDGNANGRMFAGENGKSQTAHYWLGQYTLNNELKISRDESVINLGHDNIIKKK